MERITLGLFYDLFERDGTEFAMRFGHVFDQFVGRLLASVCPQDTLWSATAWEAALGGEKPKNLGKFSDWVCPGQTRNVLIAMLGYDLKTHALSSFTLAKGKAFMDRIAPSLVE